MEPQFVIESWSRQMAEKIADDLFDGAHRLAIVESKSHESHPASTMGGWSEKAVVDRIADQLIRALSQDS